MHLAAHEHARSLEPFEHDRAAAERVLVVPAVQVTLDLAHFGDHDFEVVGIVVNDLEPEVHALGLVAQRGLLALERLHLLLHVGRDRALHTFGPAAREFAAPGRSAGRLLARVLDLARLERIGRQPRRGAPAALAGGRLLDELAVGLTGAAFAASPADLARVGQTIPRDPLCAHVADRAVERVPTGALVQTVRPGTRHVLDLLEQVLFLLHQLADDVFELLGQLGHGRVVLLQRLLHGPFLTVRAVGKPFLDVRGQRLGQLRARLLDRHRDVDLLLGQRVLGLFDLAVDLDDLVQERRIREILLRHHGEVTVRLLEELLPLVLDGGEFLQLLELVVGQVVDRRLGQRHRVLDDLLLLLDELLELLGELLKLRDHVVGQILRGGLLLELLRALHELGDHLENLLQDHDDLVLLFEDRLDAERALLAQERVFFQIAHLLDNLQHLLARNAGERVLDQPRVIVLDLDRVGGGQRQVPNVALIYAHALEAVEKRGLLRERGGVDAAGLLPPKDLRHELLPFGVVLDFLAHVGRAIHDLDREDRARTLLRRLRAIVRGREVVRDRVAAGVFLRIDGEFVFERHAGTVHVLPLAHERLGLLIAGPAEELPADDRVVVGGPAHERDPIARRHVETVGGLDDPDRGRRVLDRRDRVLDRVVFVFVVVLENDPVRARLADRQIGRPFAALFGPHEDPVPVRKRKRRARHALVRHHAHRHVRPDGRLDLARGALLGLGLQLRVFRIRVLQHQLGDGRLLDDLHLEDVRLRAAEVHAIRERTRHIPVVGAIQVPARGRAVDLPLGAEVGQFDRPFGVALVLVREHALGMKLLVVLGHDLERDRGAHEGVRGPGTDLDDPGASERGDETRGEEHAFERVRETGRRDERESEEERGRQAAPECASPQPASRDGPSEVGRLDFAHAFADRTLQKLRTADVLFVGQLHRVDEKIAEVRKRLLDVSRDLLLALGGQERTEHAGDQENEEPESEQERQGQSHLARPVRGERGQQEEPAAHVRQEDEHAFAHEHVAPQLARGANARHQPAVSGKLLFRRHAYPLSIDPRNRPPLSLDTLCLYIITQFRRAFDRGKTAASPHSRSEA